MKKTIGISIVVLAVTLVANAGVISVNFARDATGFGAIEGGESAGVIDTTDWVNVTTVGTTTGVGGSLIDITLVAQGGGQVIVARGVESSQLFNTGLRSSDAANNGTTYATIANMTAQLAADGATSYNLYVYYKSAVAGSYTADLALGQLDPLPTSTTYGAADNNTFSSTGFVLADAGDLSVEANYIKYTGLTDDTITMFVDRGNKDTMFNGFQVETIPEPATLGMVAAFGGAVIFIRRRLMM